MIDFESIERRYNWSKTRRAGLERSINYFKKNHPFFLKADIAKDRLSWTLQVVTGKSPPLVDWGFWHAGIIHDLRSVLDNVVWMIAHSDQSPNHPDKLGFPIVTEARRWGKSATDKIAELPEPCKDYIERLQPYRRAQTDLIGSTLRLLHELDIQNKHRAPVVVAVSAKQEMDNGFNVIYKEALDPTATIKIKPAHFQYQNGQVIWRQTAPKPIERLVGNFEVNAHFVIKDKSGAEYPLLGSLDHIFSGCAEVLDTLKNVCSETRN